MTRAFIIEDEPRARAYLTKLIMEYKAVMHPFVAERRELAKVDKAAVKTPEIFRFLQEKGNIPERDMFNTFNMGVGMALVASPEKAEKVLSLCPGSYVLGEIVEGNEGVILA